eukprot:TRINITY_DN19078_c0_g1_i2.p1 TRINITY_DN19078_c0_g1~~TRINITY_DN19078_c0_g1_i2.p1  ORF type:complete len:468 (+),score=60.41 TRINITY_DN19078_c0_g1_i2:62-1405(+)
MADVLSSAVRRIQRADIIVASAILLNGRGGFAVPRFPDAGFELRRPVLLEHCDELLPEGGLPSDARAAGEPYVNCLHQLRAHVRADLACDVITSNNSEYIVDAESKYIYKACDHFTLAFECFFALGLRSLPSLDDYAVEFQRDWQDFVNLQLELFKEDMSDKRDPFAFANSSEDIIQHHTELAIRSVSQIYQLPDWRTMIAAALALASRLQFLIENLSMSLLVNFLLGNLERNSIVDDKEYVLEMYGDVKGHFIFHDHIGPKRWDVLCYLLDRLMTAASQEKTGPQSRPLRMVEVGVESGNVSYRLLQHYPPSRLSLHVGVDPYFNKYGNNLGDLAYETTSARLNEFGDRSRLLRMTSEDAAAALHRDELFDLVYLDARHDHDSVIADIKAWWPRVRRPGGVLVGHDFQWQYPGLPMAVAAARQWVPMKDSPGVVNLASDGIWWFDM